LPKWKCSTPPRSRSTCRARRQYGGEYIARGGAIEVLEGSWHPKRLTIIRFESVARAKEWFNSPEYAPFKAIRKRTTKANLLVTEGL
jgi:uncharacterized protein (DUF1330 family)